MEFLLWTESKVHRTDALASVVLLVALLHHRGRLVVWGAVVGDVIVLSLGNSGHFRSRDQSFLVRFEV